MAERVRGRDRAARSTSSSAPGRRCSAGARSRSASEPNTHTCPVCLAHPGTLPVVNERAVPYGLQIALALDCEIAPRSIFHRKNYFYPDIPKGYQISQYDVPLATAGRLGGVRIHRVHLEEDAAKMIHVGRVRPDPRLGGLPGGLQPGGTPLVEIVTEPDLHSAAEAREWAQLLRTTRQADRRLGRQHGGGQPALRRQRLGPRGRASRLGTKTELKNMNSFRFLERGIEAELKRQARLRSRRARSRPGDAPLRSPRRVADRRCARRNTRTTTATSPSRTWCRWCRPRQMLAEARERAPRASCRSASERYEPSSAYRRGGRPPARLRRRARPYFDGACAATTGVGAGVLANWVTGELAAGSGVSSTRTGEARAERHPSPWRDGVEQADHPRERPRGARGARRAGRRLDPAVVTERLGLAAVSDSAELEAIVEQAIEAEPDAAEKVRAGKDEGDRPDRRRGDAGHAGPRRRGESALDQGEAGGRA